MRPQRLSFAALLSLSLLPVTALAASSSTSTGVMIVHSNDVLGEIEPCGCRTNPLGGMARKSGFLEKLQKEKDVGEILQLDSGDLLFPSTTIPPLLEKQSFLQAQYLLKSMDMVKHDAVTPGEKDFALGWESFEKLRNGTKVRFLAANLQKADGSRAFEPHAIFERKGADGKVVKIAVVGLVGPELQWPAELKAAPIVEIAKAELKELKGKADLIVALTHEGAEQDEILAKEAPGFDIIIGAHTQSFLQYPPVVGSTHIYQSSFRNQYLGVVPVTLPFTGENYYFAGLDPKYDSPKDKPSAMDHLVDEFKKAIADLNTKEAISLEAVPESPSSVKANKFHTFARCSECHLKQFDFWRKTPHAHALHPLVQAKQDRNKECLSCHTVGLGDPEGFADVTQLAKRAHGKMNTIGAEQLDTFLTTMSKVKTLDTKVRLTPLDPPQPLKQAINGLSRSWTPVQCENCHQPGGEHPFSPSYSKKVETSRCLQCHTAERAPKWYGADGKLDQKVLDAKFASMKCPAGN